MKRSKSKKPKHISILGKRKAFIVDTKIVRTKTKEPKVKIVTRYVPDLARTRKRIIQIRNEKFMVEIRKNTESPYYPDECELKYTKLGQTWDILTFNEREVKLLVKAISDFYKWDRSSLKRILKLQGANINVTRYRN